MFAEKIAEEIIVKAVEDAFYNCAMEWAWTSDPDVLVECFEREIRRIAKEHVLALRQVIEEAGKEQQGIPVATVVEYANKTKSVTWRDRDLYGIPHGTVLYAQKVIRE